MEIRRCSAAGERGITSINTRWGHFQWDETGLLTEFRPAEANSLNQPPYGYGGGRGKNHLCSLYIPAGVSAIGRCQLPDIWSVRDAHQKFEDTIVAGRLRFPDTLWELGPNAFSGSLLMDVQLPASLHKLGAGAFMCCYIYRLRLPADMPLPRVSYQEPDEAEPCLIIQGRQFKETIIDTLQVPANYPYQLLMPEALIHHVEQLWPDGGQDGCLPG